MGQLFHEINIKYKLNRKYANKYLKIKSGVKKKFTLQKVLLFFINIPSFYGHR